MTDTLNRAIRLMQSLPEAEQDRFGQSILEQLAEVDADHRWDELLADPRSPALLEELEAEALASGSSRDLDRTVDAHDRLDRRRAGGADAA